MDQDTFIPVATNARSRSDLVERGFSRQPLRIDVDIARTLSALADAAWSMARDKYYDGGDRYRSLNRFRAEIVEGGVKVWLSEESTPYVQLKKYNTTLGGQPREYSPLPAAIAGSIGVRKLIAHHLHYLPLSTVGTRYLVNMHTIRFTATPGRPCDTSPVGLHKDGEKYIVTHLLSRCGANGGEVIITDNDKREMDRFTMRESGECYVFDDDSRLAYVDACGSIGGQSVRLPRHAGIRHAARGLGTREVIRELPRRRSSQIRTPLRFSQRFTASRV